MKNLPYKIIYVAVSILRDIIMCFFFTWVKSLNDRAYNYFYRNTIFTRSAVCKIIQRIIIVEQTQLILFTIRRGYYIIHIITFVYVLCYNKIILLQELITMRTRADMIIYIINYNLYLLAALQYVYYSRTLFTINTFFSLFHTFR